MKRLKDVYDIAVSEICRTLQDYVERNGHEPTEQEMVEFDLTDEQADYGSRVAMVLNIYDDGGCYFSVQARPNADIEEGSTKSMYENFIHFAFQCLYIVEHDGKPCTLHYYAYHSHGLTMEHDAAEAEHGEMNLLTLDVLAMLLQGLTKDAVAVRVGDVKPMRRRYNPELLTYDLHDFKAGDIIYIVETDDYNATICELPQNFDPDSDTFCPARMIIHEGSDWNAYANEVITVGETTAMRLAAEWEVDRLNETNFYNV